MENNNFTDQQCKNHYFKIIMMDGMACDIASFVESKGIAHFFEQMDMDCGAVPDGNYEDVIDPNATAQFLELYTNIAEKRFSYAVDALLKFNSAYILTLKNYCFQKGTELNIPPVKNALEAFEVINACVLDGMLGTETKKIVSASQDSLTWQKVQDVHTKHWSKTQNGENVYYELLASFVEGLLFRGNFKFSNEKNLNFTISR